MIGDRDSPQICRSSVNETAGRAATEFVQAIDVRLERRALLPTPEGLIEIGESPAMVTRPTTSAAPPSSAPPRKVEKRPRFASAAT